MDDALNPTAGACLDLGVLASELDGGVASVAAIGLVVLGTDQTMEHEFRKLLTQPGVALYHSRIFNDNEITPEALEAMKPRIAPAADLILPGMPVDVLAFGCTAATMQVGEAAVFKELTAARPDARPTTPITAAFAAFEALGAKKIGLLTPYSAEVTDNARRYLEDRGVHVAAVGTFLRSNDHDAARIAPSSIRQAAATMAAAADVDAIFISCTSLRLADDIAAVEALCGKPVTSSNHAMAWHCLRLAGVETPSPEHGALFTRPLAR